MAKKTTRRPRRPLSPEPPDDLAAAARSVHHPDITRCGLTTTEDGRWALIVRVRRGTVTPVPEVEALTGNHPVVYEDEPDEPPVARPAYPNKGE